MNWSFKIEYYYIIICFRLVDIYVLNFIFKVVRIIILKIRWY